MTALIPLGVGECVALKKQRPQQTFARSMARTVEGATAAPFPGFVPFCHPTLVSKPPTRAGWLFEIKFDGYRAQLHRRDGAAKLYSRNGNDFTGKFGAVAQAAGALPCHSALIDGEVVVLGENGVPDFGALPGAIARAQHRLM